MKTVQALLLLLISSLLQFSIAEGKRYVMPWMCLEICDSKSDIQNQLSTIKSKSDVLSGVSFELYTLSTNCVLSTYDYMNISHVNQDIIDMGLESWPMISSYPHPPGYMSVIREVINDSVCAQKFIDQAILEAVSNHYVGYNLDWEPVFDDTTAPITEQDAIAFATFLDNFAIQLHDNGFKLGVDVASWATVSGGPSFWNYTAIGNTAVDKGISMGTYTSNDDSFVKQLNMLTDAFGLSRSGVGLERVNASDNSALSDNEVAFRFQQIEDAGVMEIDIWDMPIPANFWPHIEKFALGENKEKLV